LAGILAAPIRLMHEPHCRFPPELPHRQRIRHYVRRHAGFQ
jgi:hypothetical protein